MGLPRVDFFQTKFTCSDAANPVFPQRKFYVLDADIEIQNYGVKFGNGTYVDGTAANGEVLNYDVLDLSTFFLKNATVGSNAICVISGFIVDGGSGVKL